MRIIALLLLLAGSLCSQEPPRFSSTVQLVMVDVQVVEKTTGRILDLLGPKDFEVYDDGRQREIREFHFETSPLDVVFLIYGRSGFGPAKDINAFRRGLRAAGEALRPGDRAAMIRTDSAAQIDVPLTGDLERVRHALTWGDSYRVGYDHLYDAVAAGTTLFPRRKDPGRRRALVAITDDIERKSGIAVDALITELLESDVTLNEVVVVLGTRARRIGVGGGLGHSAD